MLSWLCANLIDIVLVALILTAVALVLRDMIRRKKAGKCSCGCGCASCSACQGCPACSRQKAEHSRES